MNLTNKYYISLYYKIQNYNKVSIIINTKIIICISINYNKFNNHFSDSETNLLLNVILILNKNNKLK